MILIMLDSNTAGKRDSGTTKHFPKCDGLFTRLTTN